MQFFCAKIYLKAFIFSSSAFRKKNVIICRANTCVKVIMLKGLFMHLYLTDCRNIFSSHMFYKLNSQQCLYVDMHERYMKSRYDTSTCQCIYVQASGHMLLIKYSYIGASNAAEIVRR